MAILWRAVCLMAVAMLGYLCDAQLWKGQKSQFRPRSLPVQAEPQQFAKTLPQKPSQPPQTFDLSAPPQPIPANSTDPKQTCHVEDNDKVTCGPPDITVARCQAINCCFAGQRCFYGKTATVQCTKNGQFVVVIPRDVTLTKLDLKSVHLLAGNESHCKPVISSSFAIYQFKFTECGTLITEEPGQIVYENRLSSSSEVTVGPVGAITRDTNYDLLFQCRYTGSSVEMVITEIMPVRSYHPVSHLADLNVELRLASGRCLTKGCDEDQEAYTSYYTDAHHPVTKLLRDPVYAEVRILGMTDPGVVLILNRCWATTAPQSDSLPQWDLLIDGCSFQDDRYMTIPIPVGTSSGLAYPSQYKRFALRMFTFVDPTSMDHLTEKVYIHCSTAMCHHQAGSCEQKCPTQNPSEYSEKSETACERHRGNLLRTLPGAFVPQCDEQGQYKAMQCYNSTGSCWCVDSRGQERAGSRTEPGTSQPNCDEPQPDERAKTDCEKQRDSWQASNSSGRHIAGDFKPECDKQGHYEARQCSAGYCWCVSKTGQEIAGTKMPPGTAAFSCNQPGEHLSVKEPRKTTGNVVVSSQEVNIILP
ncbi:hypothetical protein DPEC_G00333830 [Dallia pectoralis]|uniref:Uncharacterized protein n=1 Tax=Dallia pectoralis TaxID=75939 RepID=A0ACC2F6L3_DALPE|nr:hypothetical protein DPEC_G00333830 [Dallia pectoralis]